MDEKLSKETTGNGAPVKVQEKGKQTGLLILLLLLLGGFGYLYFFTSLIRPQEAPPVPQPAPQVVKQPLPARDAASVNAIKSAAQVVPPAAPATAVVPAPPSKVPEPKVAAVPAAKPEVKKAVPPVKSVGQPDSAKAAVVPAMKKAEPVKPVVVAKVEPKKIAPDHKKVVAIKSGGPWTVVVGLYVVEETLAADLSKVKKTGLTPIMTTGPKRPVTMHRLFYKEFTTREEAQKAVELVRRTAGSGFSIQRGDKHEVFVGSYAVLSGAQAEQQRLSATGVVVSIRKSQVPIASRKLTAGTFTDRKAADDVMKKLKAAGIGSPVLE
jgi:hypothetical protein